MPFLVNIYIYNNVFVKIHLISSNEKQFASIILLIEILVKLLFKRVTISNGVFEISNFEN